MAIPDCEARVARLLTRRLGMPADEITPAARLVDDLGLDSLDAMELAMSVEREFAVSVTDAEVVALTTMADLVALVQRLTDEPGGG